MRKFYSGLLTRSKRVLFTTDTVNASSSRRGRADTEKKLLMLSLSQQRREKSSLEAMAHASDEEFNVVGSTERNVMFTFSNTSES